MTRRLSLILLLLCALVAPWLPLPAAGQGDTLITSFETDRLAIETAAGERHDFEVELARSPHEQAQGLMFRRELADDGGMLFIYDSDQTISMWMKNTLIPLDMLFIEGNGRIAKVVARTVPLSTRTISSDHLVRGVLELNGGTAARLGIAPGDRVLHPVFGEAR